MDAWTRESIRPLALLVVLGVTLGLAGFLRLDDLGQHPLHADEAVQGIKLEAFLEGGWFDYDAMEYHGPLPHYAAGALLAARGRWAAGEAPLGEVDLRLAPALVGVVVVGLVCWLAAVAWGSVGVLPAGLLAAVSTSLVFYSRYYIAETFLVAGTCLFLMGAARFLGGRGQGDCGLPWFWAAVAGVGGGLMHASKETCVLSFAAAAVAGFMVYGFGRVQRKLIWVGLASGLVVSVGIYSDGFRHWPDVWESVATYLRYLGRAGGGEGHEHPWWFYLQRYAWFRGGYLWTELGVFALGLVGFVVAWLRGNRMGKFLGVYAILLVALYSLIPYKTPWSVLPAFVAWFPLAGGVLAACRGMAQRAVWLVVVLVVSGHLFVQARRATHRMPTDPRNPYAYVHTSPSVLDLVAMIDALDAVAGGELKVVVADPWMAWPLPWYLRDRESVFFRESFPGEPSAPLLLAAQTVVPESGAGSAWEGYHQKVFGLRADLPMVLFVDRQLWRALLRSRGVAE